MLLTLGLVSCLGETFSRRYVQIRILGACERLWIEMLAISCLRFFKFSKIFPHKRDNVIYAVIHVMNGITCI